jgi:hypothetical protein
MDIFLDSARERELARIMHAVKSKIYTSDLGPVEDLVLRYDVNLTDLKTVLLGIGNPFGESESLASIYEFFKNKLEDRPVCCSPRRRS